MDSSFVLIRTRQRCVALSVPVALVSQNGLHVVSVLQSIVCGEFMQLSSRNCSLPLVDRLYKLVVIKNYESAFDAV